MAEYSKVYFRYLFHSHFQNGGDCDVALAVNSKSAHHSSMLHDMKAAVAMRWQQHVFEKCLI